jgi:hypothetical protein
VLQQAAEVLGEVLLSTHENSYSLGSGHAWVSQYTAYGYWLQTVNLTARKNKSMFLSYGALTCVPTHLHARTVYDTRVPNSFLMQYTVQFLFFVGYSPYILGRISEISRLRNSLQKRNRYSPKTSKSFSN